VLYPFADFYISTPGNFVLSCYFQSARGVSVRQVSGFREMGRNV